MAILIDDLYDVPLTTFGLDSQDDLPNVNEDFSCNNGRENGKEG